MYNLNPAKKDCTVNESRTPAPTSRYEADNCTHCHASYGHTIKCPLLNREAAEQATDYKVGSTVEGFILR